MGPDRPPWEALGRFWELLEGWGGGSGQVRAWPVPVSPAAAPLAGNGCDVSVLLKEWKQRLEKVKVGDPYPRRSLGTGDPVTRQPSDPHACSLGCSRTWSVGSTAGEEEGGPRRKLASAGSRSPCSPEVLMVTVLLMVLGAE